MKATCTVASPLAAENVAYAPPSAKLNGVFATVQWAAQRQSYVYGKIYTLPTPGKLAPSVLRATVQRPEVPR